VVKSVSDLNRNDFILTSLMQRYAYMEKADKAMSNWKADLEKGI